LYTKGPEYKASWISSYDTDYLTYYDLNFRVTTSGTLDLTKYIETVSDYYIDPTTRN